MRLTIVTVLIVGLSACSSGKLRQDDTGGAGGSGGAGGTGGVAPPAEICDDGIDNDGNGKVDCADLACHNDSHCPACGDGILDPRETCDGQDMGGKSCLSLGFEAGGVLTCSSTCDFVTTSCKHTEQCDVKGDEDGNHLSDCADPACSSYAPCYVVTPTPPPTGVVVSTRIELQFSVLDGLNRYAVGVPMVMTAPLGAAVEQPLVLTAEKGVATFEVWLARKPGLQVFSATIPGSGKDIEVVIDVSDAPAGTVMTVVNAGGASGQDSSGPASLARTGPILDVQAASDGTLYVAELCRILAVSPEGELSQLAGGDCSQLSVAGIALDEAGGQLYVADSSAGLVKVLKLSTGALTTFAGGGALEGAASEGQVGTSVRLAPNGLALGKSVLHVSDAVGNRVVSLDLATTVLKTELTASTSPDVDCVGKMAVQDCSQTPCRVAEDAGGMVFVSALLCGTDVGGTAPGTRIPGVVRLTPGAAPVRVAGIRAGNGGLATNVALAGAANLTFDPGGNLFAAAGNSLVRIDGSTTEGDFLNRDPGGGFAGDGGPLNLATFRGPSGLALSRGDLYVADTGNGAIRRVVGLGSSMPTPVNLTIVSGDKQSGALGTVIAPLNFHVDSAGVAVAASASMRALDPGSVVYGEGTPVGTDGNGQRRVRLGLTIGPQLFEVRLNNLDGKVVGQSVVFNETSKFPDPGAVIALVGADGSDFNAAHLVPGKLVPALSAQNFIRAVEPAPDGSFYLSAACQILRLRGDGTLEVFAGTDAGCTTGGGDGGPALQAGIDPYSLSLDNNRQTLYVADHSIVAGSTLRAIDLITGNIRTVAGGGMLPPANGMKATDALLGSMTQLYPDGVGRMYMGGFGTLPWVYDPALGQIFQAFVGTLCPSGDPLLNIWTGTFFGDIAYVSASCSPYWLGRIYADGTLEHLADDDSYDMVTDPQGRVILSTGPKIFRYDPKDGSNTQLLDTTGFALTLALTPNGHIVYTGSGPLTIVW